MSPSISQANVEDLTYEKIEAATESARVKFKADKATGNYLPYFMMWDFGFLALIVVDNLWVYFWGRHDLWAAQGISIPIFDDPMVRDHEKMCREAITYAFLAA